MAAVARIRLVPGEVVHRGQQVLFVESGKPGILFPVCVRGDLTQVGECCRCMTPNVFLYPTAELVAALPAHEARVCLVLSCVTGVPLYWDYDQTEDDG